MGKLNSVVVSGTRSINFYVYKKWKIRIGIVSQLTFTVLEIVSPVNQTVDLFKKELL